VKTFLAPQLAPTCWGSEPRILKKAKKVFESVFLRISHSLSMWALCGRRLRSVRVGGLSTVSSTARSLPKTLSATVPPAYDPLTVERGMSSVCPWACDVVACLRAFVAVLAYVHRSLSRDWFVLVQDGTPGGRKWACFVRDRAPPPHCLTHPHLGFPW
jgi:hypothetical protein